MKLHVIVTAIALAALPRLASAQTHASAQASASVEARGAAPADGGGAGNGAQADGAGSAALQAAARAALPQIKEWLAVSEPAGQNQKVKVRAPQVAPAHP